MITQVEQTVEELARSPLLPFVRRRIDALLDDEHQRREAFHQAIAAGDPRYDGRKVEFINGEVREAMPVQMQHADIGQYLLRLLQTFVELRHLGKVGYEKLMISLTRNDYEPDICFWRAEKASAFVPHQARFPAPDFVVEILSPSTESIDRDIKFKDYAAHGIAEYWIVDPDRQTVEQYILHGDEYALAATVGEGTLTSTAVSGFQVPLTALFDAAANLQALQNILKVQS
ncbi:MAG: Uma2 family endonuclease [Chloroflexi bacterium]|nr:Uma2 family endonuclease [Chloroflexota bacterium]